MKRTMAHLVAGLLLALAGSAQAGFMDNFDQPAFDARWGSDIPNAGLASITLDTATQHAKMVTTGNTDMWGSRNNAPILWTASPAGDFYLETLVKVATTQGGTVAGITVYGDGIGSDDNEKPNFSLGLDHWNVNDRLAKIQGLGTNDPAVAVAATGGQAYLRLEVYRDGGVGGVDRYGASYKLNQADAWKPLYMLDRDVPNARMGMFFKTSGAATANFDYFASGTTQPEPPVWKLWSVDIQGTGTPVTMAGRDTYFHRGNVWNAFNVAHYSGVSTNPSMALVDSTGAASGVTFSITGKVSGYNNSVSNPIGQDYLFIRAGGADSDIDWTISGLTPDFLYDIYFYGGIGAGRDYNMLVDTDGDGSLLDETALNVDVGGRLIGGILPGDDGRILGRMLNTGHEGNWGGFQIAQVADVPEPATMALLGLASAGLARYVRRRRA